MAFVMGFPGLVELKYRPFPDLLLKNEYALRRVNPCMGCGGRGSMSSELVRFPKWSGLTEWIESSDENGAKGFGCSNPVQSIVNTHFSSRCS